MLFYNKSSFVDKNTELATKIFEGKPLAQIFQLWNIARVRLHHKGILLPEKEFKLLFYLCEVLF